MTGRNDCVANISQSMKNKVNFANDSILEIEGIVDVLLMRKDGK